MKEIPWEWCGYCVDYHAPDDLNCTLKRPDFDPEGLHRFVPEEDGSMNS